MPVLGCRRGIGIPAGACEIVFVRVYPAGVNELVFKGVVGADRRVARCWDIRRELGVVGTGRPSRSDDTDRAGSRNCRGGALAVVPTETALAVGSCGTSERFESNDEPDERVCDRLLGDGRDRAGRDVLLLLMYGRLIEPVFGLGSEGRSLSRLGVVGRSCGLPGVGNVSDEVVEGVESAREKEES